MTLTSDDLGADDQTITLGVIDFVIATTNVGHLSRFAEADL
jgi:hypothetical protein